MREINLPHKMIKNIIFDLGGVLLDIDYKLTFSKLSEIMGVDIRTDHIPAHIYKIILGYEKGEINTETFLWNLQKVSTRLTPQPDKLIKAWNAMLLGWNSNRFQFLDELRAKYNLYLVSNTNDLHLEWIRKDLKKNHKISDFDTKFFIKSYYSNTMKKRKPEIAFYEKILKDLQIKAEETLYIDDNLENIERARSLGLKAVYHEKDNEIIDVLDRYLEESTE